MTDMGTSFYGYDCAPPGYSPADYVEEWDGAEWHHETAPKWLPSCQYRFRADHAFYAPPAEWALDAAVKRSLPGLATWARFGLEYKPQHGAWLTVVALARMQEGWNDH